MKNLVIVESPTKAKTISRFLGKDFHIASSNGHIRDLPKSKMGLEIEQDFAPQYVVPRDSQKVVTQLKKIAKGAAAIYFATDEDREGEAISWHLTEILKPAPEKVKRIVFHEITEEAIREALKNPRGIDVRLVDAQQARRILDRLVGYELSPFLWRKVAIGLSAGRVQSVAVRLIVEREREIQAFKAQEYWTIDAVFRKGSDELVAKLAKVDGKSLDKFAIGSKAEAEKFVSAITPLAFAVTDVQRKEVRRSPQPPFTTSTLQQEANRRLSFSAKQTMVLAQQLYEGVELGGEGSVGLITYMRTDSVNLAGKFLGEAQAFLGQAFGKEYATGPRGYKTKSRLAQEAHEAIRPTEVHRTPESVSTFLEPNQLKLYDLIWKRAVASQMPEAVLEQTTIDIENRLTAGRIPWSESGSGQQVADRQRFTFRSTGSTVRFDGYLKVYPDAQKDVFLPAVQPKDALKLTKLDPVQHFTEPPARYSEASLVKTLEEYGIGRPSTYAPTIATVVDRGYVVKEERRLKPTEIAFLVNDVLVSHFPSVVDYQFTARMEEELDEIAEGKKGWVNVVRGFYGPFKENLTKKDQELTKKGLTEQATEFVCEKSGHPMVIKMGRFGKFLACSGYPECKNTKPLNHDGTVAERPKEELTDITCGVCGRKMVLKHGRFGPFYGCSGYPECKNIKNIEKKTGVTCPECKEGEIIEKRSKRGRIFYSCNRYPKCTFALWSKPTGEKCPESGDLLVFGPKGTVRCSSKTCKYEKVLETQAI